jgi:5-hydroxyisourate hydrolase
MRIVAQVLDGAFGKSAAGVRAQLARSDGPGWIVIADAETGQDGCLEAWDGPPLGHGVYRVVFDSGRYFAGLGASSAYPEVVLVFRAQDESATFQIKVTLAPYSYAAYFGTIDGVTN